MSATIEPNDMPEGADYSVYDEEWGGIDNYDDGGLEKLRAEQEE